MSFLGCTLLSSSSCFFVSTSVARAECRKCPTRQRLAARTFSTPLVPSMACLITVWRRCATQAWLDHPGFSSSRSPAATMLAALSCVTAATSVKILNSCATWRLCSASVAAVWLPLNREVLRTALATDQSLRRKCAVCVVYDWVAEDVHVSVVRATRPDPSSLSSWMSSAFPFWWRPRRRVVMCVRQGTLYPGSRNARSWTKPLSATMLRGR